jgi:hypothetical protein
MLDGAFTIQNKSQNQEMKIKQVDTMCAMKAIGDTANLVPSLIWTRLDVLGDQ